MSPRFNQIYEIISIDPLYQTAQLRDSNGAILSKKVHLSKLKPYFERDHSTDHPNTSVDTTAPRQINLPVQPTVVPNASANNISIQTPVTSSTTSMITQSQSHLDTVPSQAPSVNPGHSRDHQPTTVRSVQHNNLISSPRSLIPSLMPHADTLRRSTRINNRPYATQYSHFRAPMPVAKRH